MYSGSKILSGQANVSFEQFLYSKLGKIQSVTKPMIIDKFLCNLPILDRTPSPEIYLFLDINHSFIIHFH